ncbi:MAG TPA: ATP synthase F1 subunit epsilon [Candidatus Doudnabacteria bacterium]|nr:ATP synthase F1 subunit epsilon [Candidatus Doudnabacteria bacterium]
MATLKLQLITPERTVLSEEVRSLTCPTQEGQITILPNHAPLVANLVSGELITKNDGTDHFIHVAGGFIEVRKNNEIIILADAAEHHFEIDIARAEQAKKQAEELMTQQHLAEEEYATAAWLIQKNLSRINIARKHSHRRTRSITSEGVFKE